MARELEIDKQCRTFSPWSHVVALMFANKWEKISPKLSQWLEINVPESLTVFLLPEAHRRRLHTTHALEHLTKNLNDALASS